MRVAGAKILHLDEFRSAKLQAFHNTPKCIFCNRSDNLQYFRKQAVCPDCLTTIGSLYSSGYFQEESFSNA